MKIQKRVLVKKRIRRPPKSGWSWIDRRFLSEHAPSIEREAILLYFFLVAVSDKDGISYWSDVTIAARLRLTKEVIARAREELVRRDLIAHEDPLYQVLSLPSCRPAPPRSSSPRLLGDLLREIARRADTSIAPATRPAKRSERKVNP